MNGQWATASVASATVINQITAGGLRLSGLRNWSKNEPVKNFYTYVVEQTVGNKSVYRVLTVMKIRKTT
jgi:hypothetical protein